MRILPNPTSSPMLTLTLVLCLSESSKPVIGLPRLIITFNSPPPLFMAFYGRRLPYREFWFRWSPIYFLILLSFMAGVCHIGTTDAISRVLVLVLVSLVTFVLVTCHIGRFGNVGRQFTLFWSQQDLKVSAFINIYKKSKLGTQFIIGWQQI